MKLPYLAIALIVLATALPAASAAEGPAAEGNLTPASVFQNATVYVNTTRGGLAGIGMFENATVYASGGANATITGSSLDVDMGPAPEMGYRDVYLFYPVSPLFSNVSFDYDIAAGEKSNVLLIDFGESLPRLGVTKGGVPDRCVLGMGTWTYLGSQLGGLKALPRGRHHVEITQDNSVLFLKVDGNYTAFAGYTPQKYLVIHLMVGDGDSYLRGWLANLTYAGPSIDLGDTGGSNKTTSYKLPGLSASTAPSGGRSAGLPTEPAGQGGGAEHGGSRSLSGLNLWLVLIIAAAFFLAWAYVYFKYINR